MKISVDGVVFIIIIISFAVNLKCYIVKFVCFSGDLVGFFHLEVKYLRLRDLLLHIMIAGCEVGKSGGSNIMNGDSNNHNNEDDDSNNINVIKKLNEQLNDLISVINKHGDDTLQVTIYFLCSSEIFTFLSDCLL